MPPAKPKKPPKEAGPDDLVRAAAGSYVSGDGRFRVDQSDSNWYLVDTEQTNEFGQELIHGPLATLKAVKEAVPGARSIKPLLRSRKRATRMKAAAKKPAARPPPTWLDKLSAKEAAEARGLIRALQREGIAGADDVVRKDRLATLPFVATALIKQRLDKRLADLPEGERDNARRIVDDVVDVLVEEGQRTLAPLPGWALVETGPPTDHPPRRIRLR